MASAGGNCLTRNEWICGRYLSTRSDEILAALREHIDLTVTSVALGVAVAVPLVLVARRWRPAVGVVGGATSILYTIPSLAFFALLLPVSGLSTTTVRTGLVIYTLVILFRGFIAGLDGVPPDVLESARGMGYGSVRLLLTVELPLALPAIVTALRVATVSTVALVTVGATIGHGGLGNLIYDGLGSTFRAEVLTASVLCLALAVVADLLLVGLERLVTPWRRARGTRRPAGAATAAKAAAATSTEAHS
ncbi:MULTISPECIES: ABC transporter permease [unclassified Pseudofrankia]|uniref:ABC transporter permease n=1 Tax=unclassified Pseudofrankia TaxID=2994372 RepID=UPI0008DACDBC|nr:MULTISPECIES: ABC transporter permease [unclassified Pseudofrankia]MDT3445554.1 ABC transporter permease [Pseudofrankia sp. BMG5.37]OHV44330.1 ABC transporter permease [Pseudofrankia sp. BMG5.36]